MKKSILALAAEIVERNGKFSVVKTLEINRIHNSELSASQPKVVSERRNNQIMKQISPIVAEKIILIWNTVRRSQIFSKYCWLFTNTLLN